MTVDDPAYVRGFANFARTHPRVRLIGFYNGRRRERWDLATKPKSLAAYRRPILPPAR